MLSILNSSICNMGAVMGKAMPWTQPLNLVLGTLHSQFMEKDIKTFEEFHGAMIEMFETANHGLPGKHYTVPSREEAKEFYTEWCKKDDSEKKKMFVEFMKKNVSLSKVDDTMLIAGMVTPPAAMVAKRTGENVPTLNKMKVIPDVLFVPSATVLTLFCVKASARMFRKNMAS